MSIFTHWANSFSAIRLKHQAPIAAIPEDTAVLCEACHHIVSISGFIPHLTGHSETCPYCGNTDQEKLKYLAAWIRTPEEQKDHWAGRKRTGKITAINNGVPRSLQKAVNITVSNAK